MATVMERIDAHEREARHARAEEADRLSDVQPERAPAAHEQIAERAYRLWCERGCPHGSPEIDWFRAEEELGAPRTSRTIG